MTIPKRVAYLTSEYPAVSHTFILREVEALRALGVDVLTCSIRRTGPEHHRGPAERSAAATTFNVIEAAKSPARLARAIRAAFAGKLSQTLALAWRTRRPGLTGALWQLFYLVEAIVLADHLKREGITHLHGHFAQSSCTVAMLTSALSGIPFSFTLHGPADFLDPLGWCLGEKIARAEFVACISHFCRSQGMMYAPRAHWDRLRIVHCAVDPHEYGKDRAAPGKRLLFVGRLSAVKGVPVLLDAFASIRAAHPDAELTLIGDGPERAALETQAAGMQGITFAGYRSQGEVAAELEQTDIFVLPSFAEGVPVVLMEAMAARVPVVTTRIAGIPELVQDGVSGRIVHPGDGADLADAIVTLLGDGDMRARMGAAGRQKIEKDFALPNEAAWLQALFEGTAPDGTLRPTPPREPT